MTTNNPWPRPSIPLTPSEKKGIAAVRRFDLWYADLPPVARQIFWRLPRRLQLTLIDMVTHHQQERALRGNKRCLSDHLNELPIPMQMALVSMFIDTAEMVQESMTLERIFADLLHNDTYRGMYEE